MCPEAELALHGERSVDRQPANAVADGRQRVGLNAQRIKAVVCVPYFGWQRQSHITAAIGLFQHLQAGVRNIDGAAQVLDDDIGLSTVHGETHGQTAICHRIADAGIIENDMRGEADAVRTGDQVKRFIR